MTAACNAALVSIVSGGERESRNYGHSFVTAVSICTAQYSLILLTFNKLHVLIKFYSGAVAQLQRVTILFRGHYAWM